MEYDGLVSSFVPEYIGKLPQTFTVTNHHIQLKSTCLRRLLYSPNIYHFSQSDYSAHPTLLLLIVSFCDDVMAWNPPRITGSFERAHRSEMGSHHKGQAIRSFDVSFLSAWTCCLRNGWVDGDLKHITLMWRHYNVPKRMNICDEKFTLSITLPQIKIHHYQHYSCNFWRTTMLNNADV